MILYPAKQLNQDILINQFNKYVLQINMKTRYFIKAILNQFGGFRSTFKPLTSIVHSTRKNNNCTHRTDGHKRASSLSVTAVDLLREIISTLECQPSNKFRYDNYHHKHVKN